MVRGWRELAARWCRSSITGRAMILTLQAGDVSLALAGGKGANLARLLGAGFSVPGGFIITTRAYRAFVAAAPIFQGNDLNGVKSWDIPEATANGIPKGAEFTANSNRPSYPGNQAVDDETVTVRALIEPVPGGSFPSALVLLPVLVAPPAHRGTPCDRRAGNRPGRRVPALRLQLGRAPAPPRFRAEPGRRRSDRSRGGRPLSRLIPGRIDPQCSAASADRPLDMGTEPAPGRVPVPHRSEPGRSGRQRPRRRRCRNLR